MEGQHMENIVVTLTYIFDMFNVYALLYLIF